MRTIELERPDIASLAERERPDPKPPAHGQVRVRTRAASLNFLVRRVARGDYPGIAYPLIPIADAAGEIVALGPDVTGLRIGDRVALHAKPLWIAGPGTAETAQPTRGVTLPGALQEEQLVAAQSVVRAPDHLSWEEIAALPIVATTANNALRSIAAGPGDTVLLLGTGGVSIAALRLAKARGARVIVTSSSDGKLGRAKALGADEGINYRTDADWHRKAIDLTGGRGVDLVIETGGAATIGKSIAATRYGGTVFTIGFLSGASATLELFPVVGNAVKVLGSNTGSVDDLSQAIRAIAAHHLPMEIAETFALRDLSHAYGALEKGPFGKVAVRLDW